MEVVQSIDWELEFLVDICFFFYRMFDDCLLDDLEDVLREVSQAPDLNEL